MGGRESHNPELGTSRLRAIIDKQVIEKVRDTYQDKNIDFDPCKKNETTRRSPHNHHIHCILHGVIFFIDEWERCFLHQMVSIRVLGSVQMEPAKIVIMLSCKFTPTKSISYPSPTSPSIKVVSFFISAKIATNQYVSIVSLCITNPSSRLTNTNSSDKQKD